MDGHALGEEAWPAEDLGGEVACESVGDVEFGDEVSAEFWLGGGPGVVLDELGDSRSDDCSVSAFRPSHPILRCGAEVGCAGEIPAPLAR